ncbi:poly polymerase catalytic domain-containing protein [Apiospora arundinis]|uniref:Poly [ADP-ribose] polymerase n=1 Tax=Apiospora arundinis TaxID=335852 RepID=A0ABR2J921_9PEZI
MPPKKRKAAAVQPTSPPPPTSASPSASAPAPEQGRRTRAAKGKSVAATQQQPQPQSQPPPSKKAKTEPEPEPAAKVEPKKEPLAVGDAQIANPDAKLHISVDETCPLQCYEVYIDDDGVIYDAALNQTNASSNNNKFYRVQLLRNVAGDFRTWTRWGRVGEGGQSAQLGDGSLDDALKHFNKKFKDKSGLAWADRGEKPKPKKYAFIERSYAPDSEDEKDAPVKEDPGSDLASVKKEEPPASKLHPAIQELLELIFNQQYFAATMNELNYDVNKLPLGKLSKSTILRGFQALKDLSELFDNPSLAQTSHGMTYAEATEALSNSFFTLIPHAFGRQRPPVISSIERLKKEIELLESLSDMKDASGIMKADGKDASDINELDQRFNQLGMEEMTPLKRDGTEFQELANYLMATRGHTHNANYQIAQIFRIEREGEKDRFEQSEFAGPPRDRRLLWHGSRCTNFGGILSQGLRIAPPEAPVSGYMFGKGVYLADMSSKSANYCFAGSSNGHALLLLCEAELGDPMHVLTDASYNAGEDAKAKGMSSTWGQGMTGPSQWKDAKCVHPSLEGVKMPDTSMAAPGPTNVPNAYLMYNEYITYNIAQIRLRYLFRIRM